MKKFFYLYRVLHLEIHIPLKITDKIHILPNPTSLDAQNYNIKFNKNEYSYILIESENLMLEKAEIEKRVTIIYTILASFLCNQFYLENYYFFKKEDTDYEIIKVKISTIPERYLEQIPDYSFFTVLSLRNHFGDIYQSLMDNHLSDSIYYIVATLMACLREKTFETGAILGWNVLEHLSSKYWNSLGELGKKYLNKIEEKEFNELICILRGETEKFLKNLNEKSILIPGKFGDKHRRNLKGLFYSGLKSNFTNFSPAKYRIKSMFEKSEIFEKEDSYYIDKMNFIRQKLLHVGLALQQIESLNEIDFNLIKFLGKYKAFLYRKMLMFLKIVPDHAMFIDGKLVIKDERIEGSDLVFINEETQEPQRIASIRVIKTEHNNTKIDREKSSILEILLQKTNEFLKSKQNAITDANLSWDNNNVDVKMQVLIENEKFIIRMQEIPRTFYDFLYSRHHQVKGDNPEDNIDLLKPINFICIFNNYQLKFETKRSKEIRINWKQSSLSDLKEKFTGLLEMIVDTIKLVNISLL